MKAFYIMLFGFILSSCGSRQAVNLVFKGHNFNFSPQDSVLLIASYRPKVKFFSNQKFETPSYGWGSGGGFKDKILKDKIKLKVNDQNLLVANIFTTYKNKSNYKLDYLSIISKKGNFVLKFPMKGKEILSYHKHRSPINAKLLVETTPSNIEKASSLKNAANEIHSIVFEINQIRGKTKYYKNSKIDYTVESKENNELVKLIISIDGHTDFYYFFKNKLIYIYSGKSGRAYFFNKKTQPFFLDSQDFILLDRLNNSKEQKELDKLKVNLEYYRTNSS